MECAVCGVPTANISTRPRFNAGFTDTDVYRINVATGEKENLSPHEGDRRDDRVLDISPMAERCSSPPTAPGGYLNVALKSMWLPRS